MRKIFGRAAITAALAGVAAATMLTGTATAAPADSTHAGPGHHPCSYNSSHCWDGWHHHHHGVGLGVGLGLVL